MLGGGPFSITLVEHNNSSQLLTDDGTGRDLNQISTLTVTEPLAMYLYSRQIQKYCAN